MLQILLLCEDQATASDLLDISKRLGAKRPRAFDAWDALQNELNYLADVPSREPWLVILSARALTLGGFERMMYASQQLRYLPTHLHPALLIEPDQLSEQRNLAKMLSVEHFITPPLTQDSLGPQLAKIASAVFHADIRWQPPAPKPAPQPTLQPAPQPTLRPAPQPSLQPAPQPTLQAAPQGLPPQAKPTRPAPRAQAPAAPYAAPAAAPPAPAAPRVIQRDLPWVDSGSLEQLSLARLTFNLHKLGLTGALTLTPPGNQPVTFYALNGQLGALGGAESGSAAAFQHALQWNKGTYAFSPRPVHGSRFQAFDQGLNGLYQGIMTLPGAIIARRLLSHLKQYPSVTDQAQHHGSLAPDATPTIQLANLCNGSRTLEAVMMSVKAPAEQLLRWVYHAFNADLIYLEPQAQSAPVKLNYTITGRPTASSAEASPTKPAERDPRELAIIQTLSKKFQLIQTAEGYAFFGVLPGCGPDAVKARFIELIKENHPDVYGGNINKEIKQLAEEVFIQIKEIYKDLYAAEKRKASNSPGRPQSISAGRVGPSVKLRRPGGPGSRPSGPPSRPIRRSRPTPSAARSAAPSTSVPSLQRPGTPPRSGPTAQPAPAAPPNIRRSTPSAPSTPAPPSLGRNTPSPSQSGHPAFNSNPPQTNPNSSSFGRRNNASSPGRNPASSSPGRGPASSSPGRNPAASSPGRGNTSSPGRRPAPAGTSSPGRQRPAPRSAPPSASGRPAPRRGHTSVNRAVAPGQRPPPSASPPQRARRPPQRSNTGTSSPPQRPRPAQSGSTPQRRPQRQNIAPEQHFKNGENYIKVRRNQQAAEAFKCALEADPENGRYKAHYAWATFLEDTSNPNEPMRMLKEAVKMTGGARDAFLYMGHIAKLRDRHDEALGFFRKTLEVDPHCSEAQREIRVYNMRQGGNDKKESSNNSSLGSLFGRIFSKK